MNPLFLFLKLYPFIAAPIAYILFDLTKAMKQKGDKSYVAYGLGSGFLWLSILIWLFFRGDQNAESWYKSIVGGF